MECSVVAFKKIKDIQDFRIDAECFRPIHLQTEDLIGRTRHDTIGQLSKSVINFGAYSLCNYIDFLNEGMPFIVTENIKNNIIDTDRLHFISKEVHGILYKSHCKLGQVLLTMAGAYLGQAAVYYLDFEASSNQAIAKITVKGKSIEPFYLSTFLNCKFGQSQIERFRTGTGQPNLNLGLIQTIKVPLLEPHFQSRIKELVLEGIKCHKDSTNLYSQAEQILLSELSLLNWKPKHRLSFVKNFSETKSSDRIDAEYFQPMYYEIIEKLKKHSQCEILRDITKLIGHPSNPPYADEDSKNKTFVITQKHLGGYFPSDNFWEDAEALYTTNEFIKKNKQYILQPSDIILYSVGAYIGKANIYNSDINATIGSFLTLIRPDKEKINPYYLLIFLNSEFGKQLTRRFSRGMAQQYVYPFDIREFVIPLILKAKQEEIENKMLDALNTKAQSKHLLDIAKRAVEIAIEQNEKEAIQWTEREMSKYHA